MRVEDWVERFWAKYRAVVNDYDSDAFRRMVNPQIGEYAIEITSLMFTGYPNIGTIVQPDTDGSGYWEVKTLAGEIVAWEGAKFCTVPDDLMTELLAALDAAERGVKDGD